MPFFLIEYDVTVTYLDYGTYRMQLGDETVDVSGRSTMKDGVAVVECDVGGSSVKLRTVLHDGTLHVFARVIPLAHAYHVIAPMHCVVTTPRPGSGNRALAPPNLMCWGT